MATRTRTRADRQRKTEVAEAWFAYLRVTKDLGPSNYDEIEDWAWAKLQWQLRQIREEPREYASV
jgi:hypothetical protein